MRTHHVDNVLQRSILSGESVSVDNICIRNTHGFSIIFYNLTILVRLPMR